VLFNQVKHAFSNEGKFLSDVGIEPNPICTFVAGLKNPVKGSLEVGNFSTGEILWLPGLVALRFHVDTPNKEATRRRLEVLLAGIGCEPDWSCGNDAKCEPILVGYAGC
jgi:hypothetical protein